MTDALAPAAAKLAKLLPVLASDKDGEVVAAARANGEGFATLERWLGEADALFLRRERAEQIVLLPWRIWARLVKRGSP